MTRKEWRKIERMKSRRDGGWIAAAAIILSVFMLCTFSFLWIAGLL